MLRFLPHYGCEKKQSLNPAGVPVAQQAMSHNIPMTMCKKNLSQNLCCMWYPLLVMPSPASFLFNNSSWCKNALNIAYQTLLVNKWRLGTGCSQHCCCSWGGCLCGGVHQCFSFLGNHASHLSTFLEGWARRQKLYQPYQHQTLQHGQ